MVIGCEPLFSGLESKCL